MVRDLGQGLAYYRVHELPEDQPSPVSGRPGACVLDLRYAKSDVPSALTLKAWIKFNVTPHTPVFVLENAETDPALLAAVSSGGLEGFLVIAPISKSVSPDITVHVTGPEDRKAYQALEKGADVKTLLSDYPDKPRVDEAYLEKEHIADSEAPDSVSDKPDPAKPMIDAVLQRAVQIHRGLVALRKI
jgi:hypothetical protein